VTGEGDLSVIVFLRGGDLCTCEGIGTHWVRLDGKVEEPSEAAPRLELSVTGIWYEVWDGEIACAAGLPMSGPWTWPPETVEEELVFSPLEDGATWAKSVVDGLCEGTVTRTIEL
jgi:hypothetical protein